MHVTIPKLSVEERERSLGGLAVWWIETFTLIGRGDATGLPPFFTPEYFQFALNCYALDANGRRRFDRCSLWRPKGCNKSGLGAGFGLFEGFGPCRFAGWAKGGETYTFLGQTYTYEPGEPMGRPVKMPEILCLATAEDQTGNIFDTIYYNCNEGPLAQLKGLGMEVTKVRIGLPEGGEIIPSTSGDASKDGGLETFVLADEIHEYVLPKHKRMYKTVQRNLPKRHDSNPWLLEMTTYFKPGLDSVAENTLKYAEDIQAGRVKHDSGLYFDYRYSTLPIEDFSDEKKLERALYESYGSAARSSDGRDHIILPDGRMVEVDETGRSAEGWSLADDGVEPGPSKDGWQDVHDFMRQIYQPDSDINDSIRYFLNSRASSEDSWLTEPAIMSHLYGKRIVDTAMSNHMRLDEVWRKVIDRSDEITLGFDGSIRDDSTALVGCRVRDGLCFIIRLEQKPDKPTPDWKVDRDAFDAVARRVLKEYNVVGFFADPAFFENIIGDWEVEFGRRMRVQATGRDVMKFYTNNQNRAMFQALQNMHSGFEYEPVEVGAGNQPVAENVLLLADPRLLSHFRNAKRRERSFGYLIGKETPKSPHKIDACMASVLAYAARSKYLQEQREERRRSRVTRVR